MSKHTAEIYILSVGMGELCNKEKTLNDIDRAILHYKACIESEKEALKHSKRALRVLLTKKKQL